MEIIQIHKEPVAPFTEITVKLSYEEAKLVRDLVGSVTGDSKKSRRGISDRIWEKLDPLWPTRYQIDDFETPPSIRFKDIR